jgi:4'-phosphopantetheinyl transferase
MLKPRLRFVSPSTVERALSTRAVARLLSERELELFGQLEPNRRKRDWLAGRLAAKAIIRDALRYKGGVAPAHSAVTVLNDGDGAPYVVFDDRPDLGGEFNVSIAHHDGFAVAALAHTARCGFVGVDLEWDRPLADRLMRRVLTDGERQRLGSGERSQAPPNMALWSLKEAVLKASRDATRISMRHVDLSWNQHGRIAASILDRDANSIEICATWRRHGAHMLALATCRSTGAN